MNLLASIVLALILLAVLIAFEAHWSERIKKRWLKVAITVTLATIIAPATYSLLSAWSSRAETQQEKEFRDAVLIFLENTETNPEALRAILELKHRDVFRSTEEEAAEWSKEFLSSMPERQARLREIAVASESLAVRLREKWRPVLDVAMLALDARIVELSRSVDISVRSKDIQEILVAEHPRTSEEVRVIHFPNGSQLIVEADQGFLDRGRLSRPPQLIFREVRNGKRDIIFYLRFLPEIVQLRVDDRHSPTLVNTELAEEFLSETNLAQLNSAINYAIEWIFV